MAVIIYWAGKPLDLKRIVIDSNLGWAQSIAAEAHRLSLPVVMDNDQLPPEAGDLWVGLWPKNGWRTHEIEGKCGQARTSEADLVLARLRKATLG